MSPVTLGACGLVLHQANLQIGYSPQTAHGFLPRQEELGCHSVQRPLPEGPRHEEAGCGRGEPQSASWVEGLRLLEL